MKIKKACYTGPIRTIQYVDVSSLDWGGIYKRCLNGVAIARRALSCCRRHWDHPLIASVLHELDCIDVFVRERSRKRRAITGKDVAILSAYMGYASSILYPIAANQLRSSPLWEAWFYLEFMRASRKRERGLILGLPRKPIDTCEEGF